MTKTVGDLLREARNKKGLALQTIERSTGIATHNLLAIELDQFSLIEEAQLESYLRTYAQAVDVDYDGLLRETGFSLASSNPVETKLASEPQVTPEAIIKDTLAKQEKPSQVSKPAASNLRRASGRSAKASKESSGGFFKLVVGLLLVAAVVFSGFTLYKQYIADDSSKKETVASSSASDSSSSTPASSTQPSSSAPAPATKLEVSGGGDALAVKVKSTQKPIKIEVSLSGQERSWIGISNSDLGGVTLTPEEPKAVATLTEGTTQSLIELGITQGVSIKINDQVLDMSAITSTATSAISLTIE